MTGKVSASIQTAKPRLSITLVDAVVESERVLAKADTSRIVPVVTTSHIHPEATLTYTIPAADIAYINLFLDASVDTSGRYRYIAESVVLTDGKVISFTKTPSEQFSAEDITTRILNKVSADSVSLSDVIYPVLIFIRLLEETLSLSDAITKTLNRSTQDSVTAGETLSFTHSKHLFDAFALNDLADVNGTTISFSEYTNNAVSTADARFLASIKAIQESISVADSGYLFSQSYCDLTYFAEDYVGQYRTF